MPYAKAMPESYLIQSLLPMSYTIVAAVCIDRHLLQSRPLGRSDRVIDGVIFGVVIGLVQIFLYNIFVHFKVFPPFSHDMLLPRIPSGLLAIGFSSFAMISAVTAFVIGLCVPVTVADTINRNSPIRRETF
jgi:hypothetical protein